MKMDTVAGRLLSIVFALTLCTLNSVAQKVAEAPQKQNPRPTPSPTPVQVAVEPFETADAEEMASQCAVLETELGDISIGFLPKAAPETVRNFLNIASIGGFDTTAFNRVVRGFVIQGGNVSSRETIPQALRTRMNRRVPDEPSDVKHVRGIVSLARPDEPNQGRSHFFILVDDAPYLDGTFAAFGRVISGMDVVDAINKQALEGETPLNPVRLKRVVLRPCGQ